MKRRTISIDSSKNCLPMQIIKMENPWFSSTKSTVFVGRDRLTKRTIQDVSRLNSCVKSMVWSQNKPVLFSVIEWGIYDLCMYIMSGVDNSSGNIFLLCATNCPWELDPAFLRRFQRCCYIALPDMYVYIQFFCSVILGRLNTQIEADPTFLHITARPDIRSCHRGKIASPEWISLTKTWNTSLTRRKDFLAATLTLW